MRIPIPHPWRNNGHRQFELGGDAEEWVDICMIQLGPDVHFFEKFLLKDQGHREVKKGEGTLMLLSLFGGPAHGDFMATFQPSILETNITTQK